MGPQACLDDENLEMPELVISSRRIVWLSLQLHRSSLKFVYWGLLVPKSNTNMEHHL